ncbi:hypothetical protein MIND_00696700 [Mycena indigotica]|uniref:BTB domain-containing protein n=1 Tax=Mycena indigotica TaxID=2126181 RepID=A0A8H6SME6_9AGAR|nr:uncharacterized protein MIND_00696700 [Mycena indigotica]KAF7301316.1 hypothetical protein MIND_00696700 [Mycena indigotica]
MNDYEVQDWNAVAHYTDFDTGSYDHLPTPPHSHDNSPTPEAPSTLVSVSTTFFPTAQHRPHPPDLILLSKDAVYFYVHSDILAEASENNFRAMLPAVVTSDDDEPPIINVPEPSVVLNVILHAAYEISSAHYQPPFETLATAVDAMITYGMNPGSKIHPSTPLFSLLLSHAPLFPLQLYSLAAHYELEDLAVPTSAHLLAFPLSRLTDQDVERIGAKYLKRLFFLHYGRNEALKRVLGTPPHPHPPTNTCDFPAQKGLGRAWALAVAYLVWDVRPDMSTQTLESALRPLSEHLICDLCKTALNDRIKSTILQWSIVKRTI